MSISVVKFEPLANKVGFTDTHLLICLADGRELRVPIKWFPRLLSATAEQRANWQLIGGGIGIHWPSVDEDISVENLLPPHS